MESRDEDRPVPLRVRTVVSEPATPSTTTLVVSGDIDLDGAPELVRTARAALEQRPDALVLSIAEATFVDSGGLRALLEIEQLTARLGVGFELRHVAPRLERLLTLTGLAHLLRRVEED
jgi:anti-anti-sigma factor